MWNFFNKKKRKGEIVSKVQANFSESLYDKLYGGKGA